MGETRLVKPNKITRIIIESQKLVDENFLKQGC